MLFLYHYSLETMQESGFLTMKVKKPCKVNWISSNQTIILIKKEVMKFRLYAFHKTI